MRVVVQRVKKAKCLVQNQLINEIKEGYLLLVSFTHQDTIKQVEEMARKISNLRIFDDSLGKMNLNIHNINGEILSVSQFTLYGTTKKSNRPSFTESMHFEEAQSLYLEFNKQLNEIWGISTKCGAFGEHMELDVLCDGPVTILLEY